jgi:hypothetical protein
LDPIAVLEVIDDLLRNDSPRARVKGPGSSYSLDEANMCCQTLFDWLAQGGTQPDWDAYPVATAYFNARAVGRRAGKRFEMPPEGSLYEEKMGQCRFCGRPWLQGGAGFVCPVHGRV